MLENFARINFCECSKFLPIKYNKVKEIAHAGKSLISNVIIVFKLLITNPTTSSTPEQSFSLANSNVFGVRNIHKDLTDAIDLVEVGNEFVSLHDQWYQ